MISLNIANTSRSWLKCSTMYPWLQLKFRRHPKIRVWAFLCVFRVWKCHLSSRVWIVLSKLVFIEISLILTKLDISCLKCSTMDPWLKLKFRKHLEIRIWIFFYALSVSKFWLSPRVAIIICKLVFFEIYLIITKLSISCFKCSAMDQWLELTFQEYPKNII